MSSTMSEMINAPTLTEQSVAASAQTHSRFYVDIESVIFLVENTLFKLSKYPFVHGSSIFATMFDLPQGANTSSEGRSDSYPISLDGVTVKDFELFLQIIHPLEIPHVMIPNFGVAEWASVFRLAKLWMFDSVEALAKPKLDEYLISTHYPIKAILLGREFKMRGWLLHGYDMLLRREESLTDEEVALIGWESAIKIFRAREHGFRAGHVGTVPTDRRVRCATEGCQNSYTLPAPRGISCSSCGATHDSYTILAKHLTSGIVSQGPNGATLPVEDIFSSEVSSFGYYHANV